MKPRRLTLTTAAGLLLLGLPITPAPAAPAPSPVPAETSTPPAPPSPEAIAKARESRTSLVKTLHFQQGEIALSGDVAKLAVPEGFRFLGPDDAEKVLVQLWGNPPDEEKPLGMLLPAKVDPDQRGSWAVLITYEQEGYVSDKDADAINYTDLLKKMQENARNANAEREKQGYDPIEIVGWAAAPRYDKEAKKLYWAKELKFGDAERNTLNYDIRILGRRGVLVLSAISSMERLEDIQAAAPQILGMVSFQEGHRYVDFNPKTDKTAAYGLAALVAGGVAAKAGLFKLLFAGLLAAKKFVIIGVLALVAFVKKLLGGGSSSRDQA